MNKTPCSQWTPHTDHTVCLSIDPHSLAVLQAYKGTRRSRVCTSLLIHTHQQSHKLSEKETDVVCASVHIHMLTGSSASIQKQTAVVCMYLDLNWSIQSYKHTEENGCRVYLCINNPYSQILLQAFRKRNGSRVCLLSADPYTHWQSIKHTKEKGRRVYVALY